MIRSDIDALSSSVKRRRLGHAPNGSSSSLQRMLPSLHADVVEREGEYHVHVDLPGVNPSDVEVTVANGQVHISAERKQVHEEKTEFSHRIERSFGRVQRSVPIPENALGDTADARFDNGVLTVVLSKRPAVEASRKLEIKTSGASMTPAVASA